MQKPNLRTGALVGLLTTAPLAALFFLGERLAALPLVPFDVFDFIAQFPGGELYGGLVTFGIDTLVSALRLLGLSVADTSKTAEQMLGVVAYLLGGSAAAALLFAFLRRRRADPLAAGLALGLLAGLPQVAISLSARSAGSAPPFLSALWMAGFSLGWGAANGWAYRRLSAGAARIQTAPQGEGLTVEQLDRRTFLIQMGAASAAITVVGAGLSALLSAPQEEQSTGTPGALASLRADVLPLLAPLPNADDPLPPAPGTRPEYTPLDDHYRIDINLRTPSVDGDTWRLPISGLVSTPLNLTLDELASRYEPLHQFVTLACISNPVGGDLTSTTLWTGASLRAVLDEAGVLPGATHIEVQSADGFHESLALEMIRADERIMLTYAWDGYPLRRRHGFPLRVYIPDRYGMKQPKWITSIEVTQGERPGYWVVRGWDHEARMRATSVVDTVAPPEMQPDGSAIVPVGGIAHAGARGIASVEVRVDDGPWQEVPTRQPLSDKTWVIWRYDWPFEEGRHTFYVRCTGGDGQPQITSGNPPRPSGATGLHRRSADL